MNTKTSVIMAAFAFVGGLMYAEHYKPVTLLSDRAYIALAQESREAQRFLVRYPDANVSVDRSGALAVDFRINARPPTAADAVPPYLRLRVIINPRTNRPTSTFIDCRGKIHSDVLQYLQTEQCL